MWSFHLTSTEETHQIIGIYSMEVSDSGNSQSVRYAYMFLEMYLVSELGSHSTGMGLITTKLEVLSHELAPVRPSHLITSLIQLFLIIIFTRWKQLIIVQNGKHYLHLKRDHQNDKNQISMLTSVQIEKFPLRSVHLDLNLSLLILTYTLKFKSK